MAHAAEEMGLGKTVEIAALVLSNPAPPLQPQQAVTEQGHLVSRSVQAFCEHACHAMPKQINESLMNQFLGRIGMVHAKMPIPACTVGLHTRHSGPTLAFASIDCRRTPDVQVSNGCCYLFCTAPAPSAFALLVQSTPSAAACLTAGLSVSAAWLLIAKGLMIALHASKSC